MLKQETRSPEQKELDKQLLELTSKKYSYVVDEKIKGLLKKGADINAQNKFGDTSLIKACYANDAPLIKSLVALGANVNCKSGQEEKMTPLMIAVWYDNEEVMDFLLDNEAKALEINKHKHGSIAINLAKSKSNKSVINKLEQAMQKEKAQAFIKENTIKTEFNEKGQTLTITLDIKEGKKEAVKNFFGLKN